MQSRKFWLLAGVVASLAGCEKNAGETSDTSALSALPPGHVPVSPSGASDLQPVTQALLDSGNAAYRKQDFAGALRFYAKASAEQPAHAAPWFGTYMVGQATKNTTLADSALRMVRQRAPEMQAHPAEPATGVPPTSPYSPHQPGPPAGRAPSSGTPS